MSYMQSEMRRDLGFKMRSNMGEHNGNSSTSSQVGQYMLFFGMSLIGVFCLVYCIQEALKHCREKETRRKRTEMRERQ